MESKQIAATVVEDSINEFNDARITTLSLVYPRFIHSEFMTHRVFSRNASSSRAIPITKMIQQVDSHPAMPTYYGRNKSGMQAREEVDDNLRSKAIEAWHQAKDAAILEATVFANLGVHKQTTNRILEPFQLINTIVTATEWDNFFSLRLHPDAQPEIQELAKVMLEAMNNSLPKICSDTNRHEHLPYVTADERKAYGNDSCAKLSVARCARVSYKNHEGEVDAKKDLDLANMLLTSKHMSPFEHQAKVQYDSKFSRNVRGWQQYRTSVELSTPAQDKFSLLKRYHVDSSGEVIEHG